MRGKTAAPFTRSGAEDSTFGVPAGSPPEVGGPLGVRPGGSLGGSTNGELEPESEELAAGVGRAEAAAECGQGSVRNDPRDSARMPFRQRARTRNRYVVAGSSPVSAVRPVSAPRVTEVVD